MTQSRKRISIGDNVTVISGKYKGQTGKIINIIGNKNKVKIENINVKTKHVKPKKSEDQGSIQKIEGPIHYSNIKVIKK